MSKVASSKSKGMEIPFPPRNEADWLALVAGGKGERLADLSWQSEGGIVLQPIYGQRAAGTAIEARTGGRAWALVQRLDHPDPDKAAILAQADVLGGADVLELVFEPSPHAHGAGLKLDPRALQRAISLIPPDKIGLVVDAGENSLALGLALAESPIAESPISFAFDPLATLAAKGGLERSLAAHYQEAADRAPNSTALTLLIADGSIWHEAGASEVDELGIVLASLIAHLRALDGAGLEPAAALKRLGARLACDTDQITTIAKFRAFRRLTARLCHALGLKQTKLPLQGVSARRMFSRRDPHMNVLRGGIAAFGAGIGGADSICLLPFTAMLGLASPASSRLARNTQRLLIDETHLHFVADPAQGGGAFEALTDPLAQKAWRRMQEIERQGGVHAALRSGEIQAAIERTNAARMVRLKEGKMSLIGVNAFEATMPASLDCEPFPPTVPAPGSARLEKALFDSVSPLHRRSLEDLAGDVANRVRPA